MKKRLVTAVLMFALALSLVACGGGNNNDSEKPNTENTFEVLIFLVSRHMIIGHNSALDMFLSVASIAILCVIRRLLNTKFKIEKKNDEKLEKIS